MKTKRIHYPEAIGKEVIYFEIETEETFIGFSDGNYVYIVAELEPDYYGDVVRNNPYPKNVSCYLLNKFRRALASKIDTERLLSTDK